MTRKKNRPVGFLLFATDDRDGDTKGYADENIASDCQDWVGRGRVLNDLITSFEFDGECGSVCSPQPLAESEGVAELRNGLARTEQGGAQTFGGGEHARAGAMDPLR